MWLYKHEEIRGQWESVGECGGSKNVFNLGRVVFRDFRDEKCGRNAPCMGEWGMGKNGGHSILAYKTEYFAEMLSCRMCDARSRTCNGCWLTQPL